MEIKIYGLVDPRTNTIRYVGKTKQSLKIRLSRHINDKPKHNTYKYNWICSLKKEGVVPIIIELESCDETNWIEREKYWIKKIDNLTNLTTGGEGINYFAEEVLKKISEAIKKAWENPEYRKKVSEKRTEYWSDENNRNSLSLKMKEMGYQPTEHCKEMSSKLKTEQWKDTEYRENMSKQSLDLWKNKTYIEKTIVYLKSDEHRKIVSERFKGKPKTTETKNRMSLNRKNKKSVCINGIKYESITDASKLIPMNRVKLKVRIKSLNFPEYVFLKEE